MNPGDTILWVAANHEYTFPAIAFALIVLVVAIGYYFITMTEDD